MALLAAYVGVQRGRIASYDGNIMAHLAHRVVFDHALTIEASADGLGLHQPYSSYGFGLTLLLLPLAWLQGLLAPDKQTLLTLANPLLLSLCGGIVTRAGLELGWRPPVAFLSGLGFGLLTPALWQSTEAFSEPGVAFGLLACVLGLLRLRDGSTDGALWVGVGCAICILFRLDSMALVAPFVLGAALLEVRGRPGWLRALAAGCAPLGAVLLFQLWYDSHRYGSVLDAGFASQARGRGFTTPLAEGLALLLISPGKGFFWYAPILLLALPGAVLLYRKRPALTIALGSMCAARVVFYATWWSPEGGVAWGPRLLFPLTGVMALVAGECLDHAARWQGAPRRLAAAGVACLVLASAGVSALSVSIPYEKFWQASVDAAPPPARAERRRDYFWSWTDGPMAGNARLLIAGAPKPLLHFYDRPSPIGPLAIVVFAGAVAAGVRASTRPLLPRTPPP